MSKTHVTFLLDRTGSMESIRDDTIGAFNTYLGELRADGAGEISFTLITFDSWSLDKVYTAVAPKDAKNLTRESYVPRASTPLIDAACKTIKAVEKLVKDGGNPKDKVVICIQTDGQENCSTEFTWDILNALIKEKIKDGWQFNFLGCGIDAYAQGAKMGIPHMSTMSYDRMDFGATQSAYRSMGQTTRLYASGAVGQTVLSDEQRAEAKDAYANKVTPPSHKTASPNKDKPIVDDVTL